QMGVTMNFFRRHKQSESGASAVEYGLLVALIAAVVVLAVFAIGQVVKKGFGDTCTKIKAGQTTGTAASGNCAS
ncbi:MAG: Flp family type IVb pilin, partial [Nocardioidaceae bacterium]